MIDRHSPVGFTSWLLAMHYARRLAEQTGWKARVFGYRSNSGGWCYAYSFWEQP